MISALPSPILSGRGIVKKFPGVLALDRVDFDLHAGEVHGLIGENGAGKTTLMHILAGAQQPTEGEILLDGQPVHFANTSEALDQRICIVYQELNLIPYLSVAENIFLGREILGTTGLINAKSQNQRCRELLASLDPSIDPRAKLNTLRVGQQQIVEIAKALNSQARVIFMDEPTSAISDSEVEVLFKLIESLRQDGIAIVYVSHKMDELLRITDRITVLRDGKFVDTVVTSNTQQEAIVRLMIGRDLSEMYVQNVAKIGEEVLRVDSLSQRSIVGERLLVDDVSFSVAAGEVLGIFGLMGAGRTELLESIFGLHPQTTSGTVFSSEGNPQSKVARSRDGMRHWTCARRSQGARLGFANECREQHQSVEHRPHRILCVCSIDDLSNGMPSSYVEQLSIKTPSVRQATNALSGGNQQKVVLGRVLSTAPRVLLLDEPTRGIDVNAKREIYALIDQLKQQGMAIVVVSSELPELLGISDRMMVMCEGRKTAEFHREQATEENLMQAAVPGFHAEAVTHA